MFSPLRSLWVILCCVLALTSLAPASHAQNVTTWHNDINRTGWQQNETTLTQSNVNQTQFGLLWQWPVTGAVFAQPLAVTLQQSVGTCNSPCSLVFIATEEDMLYAFNATSSSQTPVWSINLASLVGGQPVACQSLTFDFAPCDGVDGAPPGPSGGVVGPYGGVTGTPVIDMTINPDTLYVVAPVYFPGPPAYISYYLFAVKIATTNHTTVPSIVISGSVTGNPPPNASSTGLCASDYPTPGNVTFDWNHIQRSGLLLMPNGEVYVAFAPAGHEVENGWMFGYSFNGSALTQTAIFASTPWGTGGGFWGSGAGPGSDGTYIYAATGNGTTFDLNQPTIPLDIGDSLLKLSSSLSVIDFYAPPDAGPARCKADTDFGSGGVLVVPSTFTYTYNVDNCSNGCNVVVNADKESKLYVTNQANLGKYNSSGGNNIEAVVTPCFGGPPGCNQNPPTQGYWASPAYWYDGTNSWIYYSPVAHNDPGAAPYPVYAYRLATSSSSGPISQTATASTAAPDLFCQYSPTPSVSSKPNALATTGIAWAIEHQNTANPTGSCTGTTPLPAALHAFTATPNHGTLMHLYDSGQSVKTKIGSPTTFSTPTIFQGQVYMGTQTEVDVFGLCPASGCLP
jgi:hypothetical protein